MIPSSKRPSHFQVFVGAILLLVAAVRPIDATLVPRMSLEQMVGEAVSIVQGAVVRKWTAWDDAHQFIWTHYEIQIVDLLKGNSSPKIVISEPGGVIGETAMQIVGTPQFDVGEEIVLFANRTPIGYLRTCGWGQGKFQVVRPKAASPFVRASRAGAELVTPAAKNASRQQPAGTALETVNGLSLDAFKNRVRQMMQASPSGAR